MTGHESGYIMAELALSLLFMTFIQMIFEHDIQLRFMQCYFVMAQEVSRLCMCIVLAGYLGICV